MVTWDDDNSGPASAFQQIAKAMLDRQYDDVRVEWRSAASASDAFQADRMRYAPRVDIAIGPFNTAPGHLEYDNEQIALLMREWFEGLDHNPNPRCLLAVEVVFNGTAKHVLGDILNSSVLGYYGLIIASEAKLPRVRRNLEYLKALTDVGKLPSLFRNVAVVTTSQFIEAMGNI